jgi:transcriptional regulator with XRE-family HTH domain
MTDRQVGRLLGAVRKHLDLRQVDVARRAGVDQTTVSLLERGRVERDSVAAFRRVCGALEIDQALSLRWRGGLGDRLIDRAHAAIVEIVIAELERLGWLTVPEFSFNVYGERGSVDVLAWHPEHRTLLIVEVKTVVTDLQGLLMSMSRKVRLVPPLAAKERSWERRALGHAVVVAATHANRAMIDRHRATFGVAYPARTLQTRAWIKAPVGDFAGLWFVSTRHETRSNDTVRRRVRVRRA